MMNKRHLITLLDWEPDEIREVLDLAHKTKQQARSRRLSRVLAGRTLALVFEKASMRTRVSFEVAMAQLGGQSIYLARSDIDLGKREPVKDGARVLSRYVDVIAARVFSHSTVEELAAYADIPVINALSDRAHPCQALADMMTIEEAFPSPQGLRVAYVGDANNVAWSLGIICLKLGTDYAIACPSAYQFSGDDVQTLNRLAGATGASLTVTEAPAAAAAGAHVLYTDTWVSMGQEQDAAQRRRDFAGYCIDSALVAQAADNAVVMHCLPAHRGNEITDEVIESERSIVFEQSENRLHAQRALLELLVPH
jgi:ornithine carbamoyltransferase